MRLRKRRERGSERRSDTRLKPRSKRAREVASGVRRAGGEAAKPLRAGLVEVVAISREMLAIPAGLALNLAERLGHGVLWVIRTLRPWALAAARLTKRGIDVAARELTPARGFAAVALLAAALLAVTQFVDYREVRAGVPAYAEVEQVAPPPQVGGSDRTAGSAHLYVLLPVALGAGAAAVLAMMGRWRLARLLVPLGLLGMLVALAIDVPAGLDEGGNAVEFEGAEARLLGGWWVQFFSSAVIAACGVLLTLALEPRRERTGDRARRGRRRLRLGPSSVREARS